MRAPWFEIVHKAKSHILEILPANTSRIRRGAAWILNRRTLPTSACNIAPNKYQSGKNMKAIDSNPSKEAITINLDQTDVNRNVVPSALIQQSCYKKLQIEIKRDLSRPRDTDQRDSHPMGSGLVYFIDGTRGAGKSTFLLAAYEALADNTGPDPVTLGKLAYIDPSRIELSETILLPILKALKHSVAKVQGSCSLDNEKPTAEFRKQFKAIAGGLSLFAPGNEQLKDIDAELFLDWGLERAENSSALRKNLHVLIHTVCKLLDVNALVLAFDDADTNAENAIKVLECIRMYLDTPELVILVTGDMELYSQQVRDNFYDSLGAHLSKMDKERHAQRTRMVDHLEDQYLLKLFPIRRRVQLRPLWNLIDVPGAVNPQPFKLTCTDWRGGTRTLENAINELIGRGLRLKDSRDIALYFEFLLKQPLRSILQILSRCAMYLSISDEIGAKEKKSDENLSEAFSESLRAMALGSLYKYDIDVDAIGAREMPALVEAVFELTVRDGELDTGAYLRPQPSDAAMKNCFAALSADVSRFCAGNPEALLQYLFGGPGSVAVYGQVLRRKSKQIEGRKTEADELHAEFKKYIGIGRKEDAMNWAWHATAILTAPYAANPKRPVVYFGVIGLNKNKPDRAIGVSARTAIKNCVTKGAVPAFAFSLIDVSGQGVGTFASIFNILGLLDRLLRLDVNASIPLNDGVRQTLARVFKTPTISRPGWEGEETSSVVDDTSDVDDHIGEKPSYLDTMSNLASSWLEKTVPFREQLKPSAVLIGKIWTRIYFSLEKVSEHQRGKTGAASLMELFALCIINAFLVEELDHHLLDNTESTATSAGKIDRSNPLGAPSVVANKFLHELVNDKNLPLTFLVASCPLIVGLLRQGRNKGNANNQSDIYKDMLSKLDTYGTKKEHLCDEDSWNNIETSCIAGWQWPLSDDEVKEKNKSNDSTPRRGRRAKTISPESDTAATK